MNDEQAPDPDIQVREADAIQVVTALHDQARDLMIHPQFAINIIGDKQEMHFGLILEFQRMPGTAFDATIVELHWHQIQFLKRFLNEHVGDYTQAEAVRKLYAPTKENSDEPEA